MITKRTISMLLTRYCDQCCSYCNVFSPYNLDNSIEVDLDLYAQTLTCITNYFPPNSEITIELSGGEPGLVGNLRKLIEMTLSTKGVHKTSLLSNGKAHKIGMEYIHLPNFEYIEHAISVNAHYPNMEDFIKYPNSYILIVLDENNLDLFKQSPNLMRIWGGMNVIPKVLTPKTAEVSKELLSSSEDILKRFLRESASSISTKQESINQLRRITQKFRLDDSRRHVCAIEVPLLYIDFSNKSIGQCCINVEMCQKCELSVTNLISVLDGKAFTYHELCSTCFKYI